MKTDNITTTDLSEYGYSELMELELTLKAWRQYGLPKDFNNDEVVPMFNKNSGYVFLTNSDYEVAMLNGDQLESFYSCPECGHEVFLDDMEHGEKDSECKEYLKEIRKVA